MLGLAVTFKKGKKEYTVYGVRHTEYNGKYLYLYMLDGMNSSSGMYLVENAKIIDVWITDLDFSYVTDETRDILQ